MSETGVTEEELAHIEAGGPIPEGLTVDRIVTTIRSLRVQLKEQEEEEGKRLDLALLLRSKGDEERCAAQQAVLVEALGRLEPDALDVRGLTEAPGNELPDAVFNLMAAVLRSTAILSDLPAAARAHMERDKALERVLEALHVDRHVVTFDAERYGVQHPARCRPNLTTCEVEQAMRDLDAPPQLGRFTVWLNGDGEPLYGPETTDPIVVALADPALSEDKP